jgi:hypothetical protein
MLCEETQWHLNQTQPIVSHAKLLDPLKVSHSNPTADNLSLPVALPAATVDRRQAHQNQRKRGQPCA